MPAEPRYLGLDLGTHTGWAIAEGTRFVGSGVRDFSVKAGHHIGKRGIKFYNFLLDLGHIDEIFYEKIQFGGGFKNKKTGQWVNPTNDGRELYHGLLMIMNMFAAGNDIPVIGVHPGTLKKAFTGSGASKKLQMCEQARSMGWRGGQAGTEEYDDEADAIALISTQVLERYGLQVTFPRHA